MPKPSTSRVPSYRCHKPTGQAVVTINGRDIYLGKWNSAESKAEYDRLIAEFLANGRRLQSDADATVVEVLNAYRKFAENYYRKDGRVTSEYGCILESLEIVRELYGRKIANDFGPLALKAVRQRMVDKGWSRGHINKAIGRIRRSTTSGSSKKSRRDRRTLATARFAGWITCCNSRQNRSTLCSIHLLAVVLSC